MKNKATTKLAGLVLASCLLLATAEGGFDGEYKSAGYNVHFFNLVSPTDGENSKETTVGFNDFTISSSNTFSGTFSDWMLHRSIVNQFVSEPEILSINNYMAGTFSDTEYGNGTVTPAPYLVLNLTPDGEDIEIPFYFSSDTNIAIQIDTGDEGGMEAIESGLGFSLYIRKGSGMDESSLSGTYLRGSMGNAVLGGGSIDRFTLVRSIVGFDGSGNYTESGVAWLADRTTAQEIITNETDRVVDSICTLSVAETPFPDSGTYSVSPDGTVVTHGLLGTVTNQLSPDGNVAASIYVVEGVAPEAHLNVAVKLPENMPTNAVDAVYFAVQLTELYLGAEVDAIYSNSVELLRAWFYLESDGSFTARGDFWGIENNLENVWSNINPPGPTNVVSKNVFRSVARGNIQFAAGTYSIETNGIMTLFFDTRDGEGDELQMQLNTDGEFIVFGDVWWDAEIGGDIGAERAMGIGIRRDPPPAPSTVVFNNDIIMTSTGLVMTATIPTNQTVECISSDDLTNGRWQSVGIYSNGTGTAEIHDPDATNATQRFYSATVAPW